MSGDIFHIQIFDGFNMKNLKNKILDILNEKASDILFYDSYNNSIEYREEDIVKNQSHFNIIIQLFFDEYLKEWEESDNAIEYDPEIDCDGDEYWN